MDRNWEAARQPVSARGLKGRWHLGIWRKGGILFFLWLGTAVAVASAGSVHSERTFAEWRRLTSTESPAPIVLVKDNQVRIYFRTNDEEVGFCAKLSRGRLREYGLHESAAFLKLERKPSETLKRSGGWRAAAVITGPEWKDLATNLVASLTPKAPGHGVYYRGLMGDRFLYRDRSGAVRYAPLSAPPPGVVIDRRYSREETLQILGAVFDAHLARMHSGTSLFLILAPGSQRFLQPMLLDRARHRCVWLSPSALSTATEPGFVLTKSFRGLSALLFEGSVLAVLKNPVSSVARLGDLLTHLATSLVRLPLPKPAGSVPPLVKGQGMDLAAWETWLDHHTRTRREKGSLELLIDGERFFPRLEQAITEATNHIHMDVYIFDTDDVAIKIADELKRRSCAVETKIVLDRLGSLAAGLVPPATPPPRDFTPPVSITSCLRKDSCVAERPFLNPFFSYDHSKVYLVDGNRAWLGGMNIGREYRSEWHDMMVEVRGPVTRSLEREFRLDWAHAGPFGDFAYLAAMLSKPRLPPLPASDTNRWIPVRLLPTKTVWKPFAKSVLGALRHAKNYIYVENPYLFDKRVLSELARARSRGVEVRVILPRALDSSAGRRAEIVGANYLLSRGVRVYHYPGMTHVKGLLADDWACVGSANLNGFGLALCQEHNIATSDPAFAARLKHDLFEEDFNHSLEMHEPLTVEWMDYLADLMVEGL
jgi:cardiolipin synthase